MPTIGTSKRPKWLDKREQQGRRKRNNQKFYNSARWRNISKMYRKLNPLCVECGKLEIIKSAQMVDHITPINEGGAKFDKENLQSLCNHHHNKKSGKEAHKK